MYIVGIGASAGGLEALERFFGSMPLGDRAAFVVIQHLSPDFKSLMGEILARQTQMPVNRVEDGMEILPGNIYLIPPKKEMTIADGHLRLTDREPARTMEMPIDIFFRSLAADVGDHAIGIILSGTGSDGTRGVLSIHEAGGLVLVQTPESSKFDGMPRSALASGIANLALPPEEMPGILARYMTDPTSFLDESIPRQSHVGENGEENLNAFDLLKKQFGIDFAFYKPTTVGRRLSRRMAMRQIDSIPEYLKFVSSNSEELNELYRDLLIGVTSFFRDPEAFESVQHLVIPALFETRDARAEIRCWVAGCATGEEVYSLAILLAEEAERRRHPGKITIFATDVHRESLDFASAGTYDRSRLGGLSEARLQRFFKEESDNVFRVSPDLRGMIVFAQHNVISDPPFTKIDFISCRNMLIYLMPVAQEKAIAMFHFALRVGGVLFLGSSETPGVLASEFDALDGKSKIYRKSRDVKLNINLRLTSTEKPRQIALPMRTMATVDRSLLRDYDLLLSQYLPDGLIVDEQREVVHIFGNATRYLSRMAGRLERDILDMVDGDLKLAIGAALHRSVQDKRKVTFKNIKVVTDGSHETVDLSVQCLRDEKPGNQHYHISFDAARQEVPPLTLDHAQLGNDDLYSGDNTAWQRVAELEDELQTTRENLQATIEELQTTNEELQAANEEMLAANEELQSTNEELHSVNEELFTVNAEFEKKNKELRELNDDLDNLLRSTEVGTLFLDHELCIRKFNPAITRSFKLLAHDVGRPVAHIAYQFSGQAEMLESLQTVLRTGSVAEQEVRTPEGGWLFRRILPFKDSNGIINGVVLTFTDITSVKQAEEDKLHLQMIEQMAASVPGMVFQFREQPTGEGGFSFLNEFGRNLFGPGETARIRLAPGLEAFVYEEDRENFIRAVQQAAATGKELEIEHRSQTDTGCVWLHTRSTAIRLADGSRLWNGVSIDITARKLAESNLARAAEYYLTILNRAPALIWRAGTDGQCDWFNETWLAFTGKSLEQEKGAGWTAGVHPEDAAECLQTYENAFSLRQPFEMEYRLLRHDGAYRWILDFGKPLYGFDGEFAGYIGYCYDVTERKQAIAELTEAKSNAEKASKSKSEFLANMSHEVRTPLNGIHGMLQLLLTLSPEGEQAEYASIAIQSCERLTNLLSDILDLSRVEAGKLAIQAKPFNLRETLRNVDDLFRPNVIKSGVHLNMRVAPAVPDMLVGDELRLQQILNNLVGNAFKFTDSGTISVEVYPLGSSDPKECRLLFAVSDTGIGVAAEHIPHLFRPFEQAGSGYARKHQGAGLGLSICRQLVSLMGGDITFESEQGEGSTILFCITLRRDDEANAAYEKAADNPAQLAGVRILLVEDDAVSRLAFGRHLAQCGAHVMEAGDGSRALDLLARERVDVVVMDIQMPGIDGLDATVRLRRGEAGEMNRHVPLVIMTAYAMTGDKERFLAIGADEYLAKPATMAALRKAISTARAGRQAQDQVATSN